MINKAVECKPGEEQWEALVMPSGTNNFGRTPGVQYDYRTPDGVLYSCVAGSLEEARAKRREWESVGPREP